MKKNLIYIGAPFLLLAVLWLGTAAVGNTSISFFPSVSISRTNFVSEEVLTNGMTIGGVRRTSWPSSGTGNVSTNGGSIPAGSIAAITGTTLGAATGAQIQGALGNVYQGTNAVLTQTATNSYDGTGHMILASAVPQNQTNATLASLGGITTNVTALNVGDLVVSNTATFSTLNVGSLGIADIAINSLVGVNASGNAVAGTLSMVANAIGYTPVSTNAPNIAVNSIAEFTSSNVVGAATSAHLQSALGNVYQGTNANLTSVSTGAGNAANWTASGTTNSSISGFGTVGVGLILPDGSPTSPALQRSGSTNAGIYFNSTPAVMFSIGAANVGFFTSTGLNVAGGVSVGISSAFGWNNNDTTLVRDALGVVQQGADAATTTAQVLKAADGSGANKDGDPYMIASGQSTGTGLPGALDLATGFTSETSASSTNGFAIRAHYKPKYTALTHTTATSLETFSLAANKVIGGTAIITCYATNSTPHMQSKTSVVTFDAVAASTTITGAISQIDNATAADSGTLTCTYTLLDNGNNTFSIQANANSSLSSPTERARVVLTAINGNAIYTLTDL